MPEKFIAGKFTPPDGKLLLVIGQDTASIDAYTAALGKAPTGVTNYTSIKDLEGIQEARDYGSGPHHLDYLAETYPDSVIAVGLSVVGYTKTTASGDADSKIDTIIDALMAYQRPVYLRFGYEFDGEWNRYDPEAFIAAWKQFHARLEAKGAENIALVWQSATWCEGTYEGHPIEAWYPGDEYVDWIGLSYFIQEAECGNQPLDEILDFARAHSKPVMISESTPQRYQVGELTYSVDGSDLEPRTAKQIWDGWYLPYFEYIYTNADVIRVVAYINADWDSQSMWGPPYQNGYWGDSRVEANQAILDGWLNEIGKDAWLQGGADLFETLDYPAP